MRLQTDPKPEKTLDQLAAEINAAAMSKSDSIPDLTDDQLRKLAREKLSEALQAVSPSTQPELTRKLCAELMDRLDGKPGQSVTLDANIRTVTVNATIRFADEPHMVIEHEPTSGNAIEHIEDKG